MDRHANDLANYLKVDSVDEAWGIVVTTVGYQFIMSSNQYPLSQHPDNYNFKKDGKRILNEYQLVYITAGRGYFTSESCKTTLVEAGTIILLFPGEWHKYYPDNKTGWNEYWVGFKGPHIDNRVKSGFFSPQNCIFKVGLDDKIIDIYQNIINYSSKERAGLQQLVSSIVLQILGMIHYKNLNKDFNNSSYTEDIVKRAKIIMKDNIHEAITSQEIAATLGISYSLFRREFKKYCGISPGQYQQQLKLLKAKELLSEAHMTISEIAYQLNFECIGQFSTFFHKKEGITPSTFRKKIHCSENLSLHAG